MRQRRIALFVNNLDEEYQISIFKSVREAANTLGYQLICIQAEMIFANKRQSFQFYSAPWLKADGILFLSSVLSHELVKTEETYISQLFNTIPCVSIGNDLSNFPSILIHSREAFSSLIKHLVDTHGYRNILYIGGPEKHHDNRIREKLLVKLTNEYSNKNIPINLTIEHGAFHEYSGMIITQKYIQQRPRDPFDVIIAANDNMAMGAIKAIETSENPLWKKCAITGFDDIPLASLEYPPITTIHQPLDILGKEAVLLLDSFIRHIECTTIGSVSRYVECNLVIRESCGCHTTDHPTAITNNIHNYTSLPPTILRGNTTSLNYTDYSTFLYLSIKSEQNMRNLSYLGQRLITVNTHEGMIQHLSDFLSNLSVSLCYLFIFPAPTLDLQTMAHLIYKRSNKHNEYYSVASSLCSIQQVLQEAEEQVLCVYPLRTGGKYVGILVYNSFDYAQPHMCSCATFLSNNLHRLYELEQEKKRTQILEDQVQQRTQELLKAFKELQEESQRREAVELEVLRISEMERLRFSLDLHDDICQRLAGLSMYCKSMVSQIPALHEVIQMIDETLLLTRRYAHDAFPIELENLGLEKAFENLLSTLERHTSCSYTLRWDCPVESMHLSKAQEINIYRIAQEVVNNSITHGKATKLTVHAMVDENKKFHLSLSDNGHGNDLLNQFPANMNVGGVGLRSMQYRTHQLHGTLSIQSSVQKGTTVSIVIPIESM